MLRERNSQDEAVSQVWRSDQFGDSSSDEADDVRRDRVRSRRIASRVRRRRIFAGIGWCDRTSGSADHASERNAIGSADGSADASSIPAPYADSDIVTDAAAFSDSNAKADSNANANADCDTDEQTDANAGSSDHHAFRNRLSRARCGR